MLRLVVAEIGRGGYVPERDIGRLGALVGVGLDGRHGLESSFQ